MTTARSTLVFLSPLASSSLSAKRGGPWHFKLVQAGGPEPIKLEYPSQDEARAARRTIMGNHHTQGIASVALFDAISTGLREAFKAGHDAVTAENHAEAES